MSIEEIRQRIDETLRELGRDGADLNDVVSVLCQFADHSRDMMEERRLHAFANGKPDRTAEEG